MNYKIHNAYRPTKFDQLVSGDEFHNPKSQQLICSFVEWERDKKGRIKKGLIKTHRDQSPKQVEPSYLQGLLDGGAIWIRIKTHLTYQDQK